MRRVLAGLLALLLVALGIGFAWFLHAVRSVPSAPAGHTAGIAVLTGGADRVETGLLLLRDGQAGRLLVSGAHRDVTLADLARRAGLDEATLAGTVAIGRGAASTRGNAAEIAQWARTERLGSIRVVTAAYHMPRAMMELRRDLGDVLLVPHPVVPPRLRGPEALGDWRNWALLGFEYLKLIGAVLGLGGLDGAGRAAIEPPPGRAD